MSFDPNQFVEGNRYDAKITAASITESDKGTVGIYLRAATDHGDIDGTLWVTPNTRDRLIRTIEDLGLDPAILSDDAFWDAPGHTMVGIECSIVTEINDYEGDTSWRVKWWNAKRKVATSAAKQRAKGIFGAFGLSDSQLREDTPLTDDEVPY